MGRIFHPLIHSTTNGHYAEHGKSSPTSPCTLCLPATALWGALQDDCLQNNPVKKQFHPNCNKLSELGTLRIKHGPYVLCSVYFCMYICVICFVSWNLYQADNKFHQPGCVVIKRINQSINQSIITQQKRKKGSERVSGRLSVVSFYNRHWGPPPQPKPREEVPE